MISHCPHCHRELKFSGAQRAKIDKALLALQPGKILKLACPQCRAPIELEGGADAAGVMEDILYSTGGGKSTPARRPAPVQAPPHAPQPPDISWLAKGDFQPGEQWVEDVLTALVLVPGEKSRGTVIDAFEESGYQVVAVESAAEAIERMRFSKFSAVVYHAAFESGGLAASRFHKHMRAMAMGKRRYIYYMLIGPGFKTFYELEALAYSANVVVNEAELGYLPLILKKGLHDYEELFAPLLMTLREYGKR
jgi:hypothetical protein